MRIAFKSFLESSRFSNEPFTDKSGLDEVWEIKLLLKSFQNGFIELKYHVCQHNFTTSLVLNERIEQHKRVDKVYRFDIYRHTKRDRSVVTA